MAAVVEETRTLSEEEERLFRHGVASVTLLDGLALVVLACRQGHASLGVKLRKNKTDNDIHLFVALHKTQRALCGKVTPHVLLNAYQEACAGTSLIQACLFAPKEECK